MYDQLLLSCQTQSSPASWTSRSCGCSGPLGGRRRFPWCFGWFLQCGHLLFREEIGFDSFYYWLPINHALLVTCRIFSLMLTFYEIFYDIANILYFVILTIKMTSCLNNKMWTFPASRLQQRRLWQWQWDGHYYIAMGGDLTLPGPPTRHMTHDHKSCTLHLDNWDCNTTSHFTILQIIVCKCATKIF